MNNVHSIFKPVIAHIAPPIAPTLRPFEVSITIDGETHELNVLAFTSFDAVARAINIFFDGDEPMPSDGLRIEATRMLPKAA